MENTLSVQHYILLKIDGIQLCFPKQHGTVVDLASVIRKRSDNVTGSVGIVVRGQQKWPAFSINRNFTLLSNISDQQKFCVNFGLSEQRPFALLCNEVTNVKAIDTISPQSLPICMQTPLSPITQLFHYNDDLVFILDQNLMLNYITERKRNHG